MSPVDMRAPLAKCETENLCSEYNDLIIKGLSHHGITLTRYMRSSMTERSTGAAACRIVNYGARCKTRVCAIKRRVSRSTSTPTREAEGAKKRKRQQKFVVVVIPVPRYTPRTSDCATCHYGKPNCCASVINASVISDRVNNPYYYVACSCGTLDPAASFLPATMITVDKTN